MRYIPHTPEDVQDMLKVIGVDSVEKLFDGIPKDLRMKDELSLHHPLAEKELRRHLHDLAEHNISLSEGINFIGAGAYHHYVPAVIPQIISRGEFLTAYTPYQAEVSQGTLQGIFEYQSLMCELTGMDVANASVYDLSTACAEAVMMANRVNGKKKALVARSVHPHYRDVLKTYLKGLQIEIVEIPFGKEGQVDANFIKDHLDDSVTAVLIQSPNFFGVIEDLAPIGKLKENKPALFVVATAEAMSYAVLPTPGEVGADIAIGEGLSFGLGTNYGGPSLGIFATRTQYVRNMPGRLVGRTTDADGKPGYVLTLATREQHIRREKATSNICSNEGLCALTASIYLSLLGPEGLKKLALLNMHRLKQLEDGLFAKSNKAIHFKVPKFNETVIALKTPVKDAVIHLLKDKIFAGIDLGTYYPEFEHHLLVCTTEMVSNLDVRVFVERMGQFI